MSINISIVTGVILNNRDLHFASDGTHNLYKVDNEKMVKFRTTLELLSERLIKYNGFDPDVVYHVFVFNKDNYKKQFNILILNRMIISMRFLMNSLAMI